MTFEVTVIIDDLVAFNEDYLETTFGRTIARNRWINSIATGVLSGVLVGLWIARDNLVSGVVVGSLVGLVTLVAMPFVQRDRVKKIVRRAHENTDDKTATGIHAYLINGEGIRTTTLHSESLYKWSAVQRVRFVRGRIFVYVGPNKALVIPTASIQGSSAELVLAALRIHLPALSVVGHGAQESE